MSEREALVHELKCWPEYYSHIEDGSKPFEIRRDDRGFKVGHVLWLKEYDPQSQTYSGRSCRKRVTYITDFGQHPEMIVMGIAALTAPQPADVMESLADWHETLAKAQPDGVVVPIKEFDMLVKWAGTDQHMPNEMLRPIKALLAAKEPQ